MRFTKILMLVAFAASTTLASAQFANTSKSSSSRSSNGTGFTLNKDLPSYNRLSFGYSGVNFNVSYNGKADDEESHTLKGLTISYVRGIKLTSSQPLFLEVGGELNFGTYKESEDEDYDDFEYTRRENRLALSVPVSLTYKLGFSNGIYIAPYAGIHMDLGLIHKAKDTYSDEDESETDTWNFYSSKDMGKGETLKRFQMGYQVGANIGYKQFNFGVGYKGEFTPIYSHQKYKITTGGPVVTIGYNF